MNRLTFSGNFCDIAMCSAIPSKELCGENGCLQKQIWERLKEYEDIGMTPIECKNTARKLENLRKKNDKNVWRLQNQRNELALLHEKVKYYKDLEAQRTLKGNE